MHLHMRYINQKPQLVARKRLNTSKKLVKYQKEKQDNKSAIIVLSFS